jgi:hypothetical protein
LKALAPNIDERGASARLKGSRVLLLLSAICLFLPLPRWLSLILFGLLLILGLFTRYEAKKKWCALRACGIKTPV